MASKLNRSAFYNLGVAILLVGAVVAVVMLVRHEADATHRPGATFGAVPADTDNEFNPQLTSDAIQTWLISDATVTSNHQGLVLDGQLTEDAGLNPNTTSTHIAQLLSDACVNTVSLAAPDNMQLDMYGFCFNALDPEVLSPLFQSALNDDADALTILRYADRDNETHAELTWFADTAAEQEDIVARWDDIVVDPAFEEFTLTVYGPGEIVNSHIEKGDDKPTLTVSPNN